MDHGLKNKVVLITGANHGIGAAAVKAFAVQDSRIFVTYFRDKCKYTQEELRIAKEKGIGGDILYHAFQQQTADSLIHDIKANGETASSLEIDLSLPENIPLYDMCENQLGPVDILINNHTYCEPETFDPEAIIKKDGKVSLISAKGIDDHFEVNARSYALMMSEYSIRYFKRKAECDF